MNKKLEVVPSSFIIQPNKDTRENISQPQFQQHCMVKVLLLFILLVPNKHSMTILDAFLPLFPIGYSTIMQLTTVFTSQGKTPWKHNTMTMKTNMMVCLKLLCFALFVSKIEIVDSFLSLIWTSLYLIIIIIRKVVNLSAWSCSLLKFGATSYIIKAAVTYQKKEKGSC